MRKIIVTEFLSVDGVMEAPEKWSFPYMNEEIMKFKRDELFASGALLLGRRTYETFAAAWPSRTDPEGFAERMNSLPKYVLSSTLKELAWNNSKLIKGNAVEEISRLKSELAQDIVVHGGHTRQLAAARRIDRRIPSARVSARAGAWQTPFRGGRRGETQAGRNKAIRHGRRRAGLPARHERLNGTRKDGMRGREAYAAVMLDFDRLLACRRLSCECLLAHALVRRPS